MNVLSEIVNYLHLLRDGAIAAIVCAILVVLVGGVAVAALAQVCLLRQELTALRLRMFPPAPPQPPSSYPAPWPRADHRVPGPPPGYPRSPGEALASKKDAA